MKHNLNKPEPTPTKNDRPIVWHLVMADMMVRDYVGETKYGTPLQPFNGRDALVDAYQEALDLAVYLRQAIYERDTMATKTVGKMKVTEKDGKVKLTRVRKFDASKARRIAKSKTKRVTSPARARAVR